MADNMERYLIEHCSPTLASVKAANLFNAVLEDGTALEETLREWNRLMNPRGVKLLVLRSHGNRALVYVYREKLLREKLWHKLANQSLTSKLDELGGIFRCGCE